VFSEILSHIVRSIITLEAEITSEFLYFASYRQRKKLTPPIIPFTLTLIFTVTKTDVKL